MNPRRIAVLVVALVVGGCVGHGSLGSRLQGSWSPERAELGGKPFPVASFNGAMLHLTASSYEFAGDKGELVLLAPSKPAKMDIVGREGPNAGRTIPAIYEFAESSLTVCYQLGTGSRPTEFTSPQGSQVFVVRYKRVP